MMSKMNSHLVIYFDSYSRSMWNIIVLLIVFVFL